MHIDPALAERLGTISTKAQIAGTADLPSYLKLLARAISIGGLIVFGFNTSWIIGREYSDKTIKGLLDLPVSRNTIVFAKFIVAFVWSIILAAYLYIMGILLGLLIDIPGGSSEVILQGTIEFMLYSMSAIVLSTPLALFY